MVLDNQEYMNVVETNLDLGIDLEATLDSLDSMDVRDCVGFEYPAMLITGVKFNDSLRVLQTVHEKSYRLVDVWIDLGDGSAPVRQGQLPLNSRTLLALRYLGLTVTVYPEPGEVRTLDLNDISILEDCI